MPLTLERIDEMKHNVDNTQCCRMTIYENATNIDCVVVSYEDIIELLELARETIERKLAV